MNNNKKYSNENSNKKEISNYKVKPTGNANNNHINLHNVEVKVKKSYDNEINKKNYGYKSPNARNKNEVNFKKEKSMKDDIAINEKNDKNERRNSHHNKILAF